MRRPSDLCRLDPFSLVTRRESRLCSSSELPGWAATRGRGRCCTSCDRASSPTRLGAARRGRGGRDLHRRPSPGAAWARRGQDRHRDRRRTAHPHGRRRASRCLSFPVRQRPSSRRSFTLRSSPRRAPYSPTPGVRAWRFGNSGSTTARARAVEDTSPSICCRGRTRPSGIRRPG